MADRPNIPPPPGSMGGSQWAPKPNQPNHAWELGKWQTTSPWTLFQQLSHVVWFVAVFFFMNFGFVSWFSATGNRVGATGSPVEAAFTNVSASLFFPLVFLLFPLVRWFSIRWRLDEQTIEFREGILSKKHQKMARSRVQTVTLNAGILARLTNTRTVIISSGDTEDIVIGLIPLARAEQLRIAIAPRLDQASQPDATLTRDPVRDAIIKHPSPGQTAPHEAGQMMPPAQGKVQKIASLSVSQWLTYVVLNMTPFLIMVTGFILPVLIVMLFISSNSSSSVGILFLLSSPGLLFLFLPVVFGISVAQLNNWGFTSWIQDERIHSIQGLINRFERGAALSRIQTVSVGQNPLRMLLKLDEITVSTADAATVSSEDNVASTFELVHPLLGAGQWRALAQDLLHLNIPEDMNPPSRRTIGRGVVQTLMRGLPIAAISGLIEWLFANTWYSGMILAVFVLVMAYPMGLWRFHTFRWAINDECFVVRRGLLFRTISVVPFSMVQNVKADATFFQRRLGLGDVQADVAGGRAPFVCAHDLPRDIADQIESVLVTHAVHGVNRDGV